MSVKSPDLKRIRNPHLVMALRRADASSHRKPEATRRQDDARIVRHHLLVGMPRERDDA